MSRISSKDKRKVSNIRKCIHIENNSTTSEQEETQLTIKSSNNPSYVWHHFTVLDDKIHAQCQICDRKGKNIKYIFHGTTSNMIYHLENEHGITKNNSTGDMEDGNIEDFFEVAHGKAARKKQPIIEIAMLTWMIDDSVDKLNELYRIEQTIIIEESNDNLSNNLPKPSLTNKPSNVNQVNYSLLGLSDDSDEEESNISNEVFRYLALPKEAQECNVLEWWKERVNILPVLSRLAIKYL
ncbi:hypothetical protein F8M41_012673 [Gigaspora margarita]|uniref:BED-type domain-containing protein n=1 Tax=Gigaspora margarita TaxID=4874 RepID=A0A8H3WZK9_GIGMA|nr:hypothetical protein F8M41_012673 [Gigaspora margarita]